MCDNNSACAGISVEWSYIVYSHHDQDVPILKWTFYAYWPSLYPAFLN